MVRFQKILCPVDFFPGSLRALDYAVKLAKNYGAGIHALHVVSPVISGAYGTEISVASLTAAFQKDSIHQMAALKTKLKKSGVPIETEVLLGTIDVEIRRAIAKRKIDLVVVGTHGRRGVERWVLGSVTERLMRHCTVPLLVTASDRHIRSAPPAIRRILVTTDFSEGTAGTLKYAFSMAQECQAKITLLHIVDDVSVDLPYKLRESVIRGVRRKLEELLPSGVRDWCDIKTRIETGMPYRAILKILKSEKADLLVMNVHGKSLLERALIGSTAERVVRAAPCPVLLIPRGLRAGQ